MRDRILGLRRHIGKADAGLVGHEYRIVTESVSSGALDSYSTVYTPLKDLLLSIETEGYHSGEMCLPVSLSVHLFEKFGHICFRVMSLSGIPG